MRMVMFGKFSHWEVMLHHTVLLQIEPPRKRIPVNSYALLEYYCDEPDCDCRRVMLDAVSSDQPGRIFASIHFGWERPAFYRNRGMDTVTASALRRGMLNPANFDCDWADTILRHVRKKVLSDRHAVAGFRWHYALLKCGQRRRARGQQD